MQIPHAFFARKTKALGFTLPKPGEYAVVVKVIDILGNDTTKTMSVKVGGRGAQGT